jgi:hypothetical protein
VSVVLDAMKGRKRGSPSQSSGQGEGKVKMDWVVILEFEAEVQEGSDCHYQKVCPLLLFSLTFKLTG